MKIKITSDSTCDLSREQIKENEIGIFSLSVSLGENSYKDGEIFPEDIFEFVKNEDKHKEERKAKCMVRGTSVPRE